MDDAEKFQQKPWYEPDEFNYVKYFAEIVVKKINDVSFTFRLHEYKPERFEKIDTKLKKYDFTKHDQFGEMYFSELDTEDEEILRDIGEGAYGYWIMGWNKKNGEFLSQITFKHYRYKEQMWTLSEEQKQKADERAEKWAEVIGDGYYA